ncbi:MAG: tetratricopeptide repeat protein [Myxococcales bacterium]|nr:tetratricopeptide repeat protein [Myxococcales bacterium]
MRSFAWSRTWPRQFTLVSCAALFLSAALSQSGCASTKPTVSATEGGLKRTSGESSVSAPGADEDEGPWAQQVQQGITLVRSRQPERAIREHFEPVIAHYESRYAGTATRYYCATSNAEALGYSLLAAKDGVSAKVLGPVWATAYFFKGYALVELGNADDARTWVEKALVLSPWSWQYLVELGHIQQARHDWQAALKLFGEALDHASLGSPEDLVGRKTRALRGLGFSLIELGRLDEAEARFRAALDLDPNDERSKNELLYITQLRKQGRDTPGSL